MSTGRPITIDDLYDIPLVAEPNLSPDGTQVAVSVTTIDRDRDEYDAALWLVAIDGSTRTRLTGGRWSDTAPRWSPDGRWIAFISNRTDRKPQIWVLPTAGGEARQVTTLENGAAEHDWAPDSRHLVFTSKLDPEPADNADEESDVRVITSTRYKFDGQGFLEAKLKHVFTIDALSDGATPTRLTHGAFEHDSPRWSPGGHEIAFLANRTHGWESCPERDIWTVPATDGEPRRLTDGTGSFRAISWSPDGTRLAAIGERTVADRYQHPGLFTLPAAGREPTGLSNDLDRAIGDATTGGTLTTGHSTNLRWSGDGSAVVTLVSDEGSVHVQRFPIDGGDSIRLTFGAHHIAAFDLVGATLVTTMSDAGSPMELMTWTDGSPTPLTTFTEEWRNEVAIAAPESFWIDVNDTRIQGWLVRPDTNDPVPLILYIHGGPHMQFGPAFWHELQLFVAQGYAVVYINPRGSVGYSESFAQAVAGAWGHADADDFLAAVDYVVARGGIDETRIGVTGGSYGGFMTNWLLGTSTRFRAAVTDRSICNMTSMYGTDDIALLSLDREMGTPWDNPETYWNMSPLKHVGAVTAPCLIIHSENDFRCPMEQAEQWFTALKRRGIATELVRFPDESHGLGRNGKPKHRVERHRRTLDWFRQYL